MEQAPECKNPNTPEYREAFFRERRNVPAERIAQIRAMIVTTTVDRVPLPPEKERLLFDSMPQGK